MSKQTEIAPFETKKPVTQTRDWFHTQKVRDCQDVFVWFIYISAGVFVMVV